MGSTSEREFEAFVARHSRGLLRQAYALTADPEEAKDLVQETFERAWRSWRRVSRLESPGGWAHHVLSNLAVSAWRRRTTRERLAAPDLKAGFAPDAGHLDLAAALRSLPPKQRDALVLRGVLEMTVTEVAAELGASEATVRSWLSRGRRELARKLGLEAAQSRGCDRDGG